MVLFSVGADSISARLGTPRGGRHLPAENQLICVRLVFCVDFAGGAKHIPLRFIFKFATQALTLPYHVLENFIVCGLENVRSR